ncbi:2-dehydro-3-deoxy-D-gluconate 5-dehydrogenase KduD [Candidatus Bipolaricaulota bacterium]|nr:2-dehydro-3-deoxy-D-gluconate 5-dehydrogenase KduD [Candidatus Bipolaricaulota bacterium]
MILDAFNLEGKVALVTGAARGLGQAMAVGLAEAGADIVGIDIITPLSETKRRIESLGRRFVEIQADLSKTADIQKILETAESQLGGFDILINNAGIIRRHPAHEFPVEDWDAVMNVNLRSLFFLTQAFGKSLIDKGQPGKIVNVCSMLSFSGGILVAPYTASKSAVAGITRLLGNEWAPHRINVNGIAPGYMATDNTAPLRADPDRNREILSRVPMDRWGEPEDLCGTIVFLSSAASDYITGTIVRVDGGWLTR